MQKCLIAFDQEPDSMKDLAFRIAHHMKLAQEFPELGGRKIGLRPQNFQGSKIVGRGTTGFQEWGLHDN
jgi:hypothetical protein